MQNNNIFFKLLIFIHKNNINLDDLQDEIDLKTVLDNK